MTPPGSAVGAPLASMLLMAFRQQDSVAEAIAGALAQTYAPLEIVISDDASPDGTWDAIQGAVAGYVGPHRLVLSRNPRNLGIGAHLSRLVALSHGELLFITAGDDVSLPERCECCVAAWLQSGKALDLIAAPLIDVDAQGRTHGTVRPDDLSLWRGAADWAARRPFIVGAAQAFTRRLFEHIGPLPEGTVAEDLILVFRAIGSGGAATHDTPLVRYRRGGQSQRRRALHAAEVRERLLRNARHALVELPQLLADADVAGVRAAVAAELESQLARERHVAAQLSADADAAGRWRRLLGDRAVPLATRLRVFVYAACPALLAPGFALTRAWAGQRR